MTAKNIFFTPGPSELYFTVPDHLKKGLKEGVASISHRSKQFEKIHQEACNELQQLLQFPDHFQVIFLNSASENWDKLIINCVERESFHLVNGAFSEKFYKTALLHGINANKIEVEPGNGFDIKSLKISGSPELIALIDNETSTGVKTDLSNLSPVRSMHPDALIVVDAVSSIPTTTLDFDNLDAVYFSVQKGFGLPAGLSVIMVNQRIIDKIDQVKNSAKTIGYTTDLSLHFENNKKHQTLNTPNILGIYLLAKVAKDMNTKGIEAILRETDYKAALLYNLLESHHQFEPFVKKPEWRSKTVVVAETSDQSNLIIDYLRQHKIIVGTGYGPYKNDQIRIANFPTHSKEQMERLHDHLKTLDFNK